MMRRILAAGVLAAASLALGAAPVAAPAGAAVPEGQMFTVEWNGGLYTVDPATGATTFVADTGVSAITGLVWDAATSSLLGVTYDGPCVLTRIDPTTGASTAVGPTGHDDCTGLDRNPTDGVLFAVYDAGDGSILMTVDAATGASQVVDTVNVGGADLRLASLAFQSDGTLLGIGYDGDLYSVSTANAAATLVKTAVIGGDTGYAANFDCSNVLYVTDDTELFTVDVAGGTFDDIGTMFAPESDLFSENLTVACGVTPPPPTTTPPAPPEPPPAPAAQLVATPRFTG
jgi:hypothetical protein